MTWYDVGVPAVRAFVALLAICALAVAGYGAWSVATGHPACPAGMRQVLTGEYPQSQVEGNGDVTTIMVPQYRCEK